ncbi:MAG: glycosyltransferase [Pyrinomonadaceae bacterium]
MNASKKVSVIIPSYNASHFVVAAVESVLAQTHSNIEVIVVDDGSTDSTSGVLEAYLDRIRYFRKENGGVSLARNFGAEAATGEYLAFLDADDVWLPEKIELQLKAILESDNAKASHTAFFVTDEHLEPVGTTRSDLGGNLIEDLLFSGNVVGTPSSVVVEKELFLQSKGFDPELSYCADWDMWIKLALLTGFAYVDEPLVKYRQHSENMSNNASLLESDSVKMFEKVFAGGMLPSEFSKRRSDVDGRNYMVLAGTYFQAGSYADFMRCAARSIKNQPSQIAYLLGFPLRLIRKSGGAS